MTSDVEQFRERVTALTTVQRIAQELMSELDRRRLLQRILASAVKVLNADTGSLLIWVPPGDLEFAVSQDPQLVGRHISADQGIAGWVFTHERPLIVDDVNKESRWSQEVDPDYQTQSLIAVPLMTPTERIGVIEVLNKKSGEQFTEQDQDILSALAAQAAAAIVNARLYEELEEEKNRIIDLEGQTHKKLARDLHDGPAQQLAAMIMDIEFIVRLYEREPDRVPDELGKLRDAAVRTLAQIRNTMFELRPVILETQGLKAALESYVERLITTEDMNIHLDIRDLGERFLPKIEEVCFAIVQEAVGNVKKHAHAENVWIIVERRDRDLIVAVKDDGEGFDVAEVEQGYDRRGSLGLLNIKERSEMLGARHAIESAPGQGTLVYLIVPLTIQDESSTGSGNGRRRPGTGSLTDANDHSASQQSIRQRYRGTGPLSMLPSENQPGNDAEAG